MFGNAAGAQPATSGSYGEPPSGYRLPGGTRLGPVRLQIADLGRSIAYYETTLGMRVLHRDGSLAVLGARHDDQPLVELRERAGVRAAPRRGRLGLFHFAILLPDRPSLGQFLRHLGEIGASVGAANHLVSESLYLQDPDNLGVEVYADRPRNKWRRIGRELMMATDPLDLAGLAREAGIEPWTGMPRGPVMGHVHLHVGDLAAASAFYSEALGFDRTVWHYPGALFLAAGGYHHHLGTNIWAGSGATSPTADDAQLLEWTIELPDQANLDAASQHLERAGHPLECNEAGNARSFATRDPWGIQVRLRSAALPL
ncbi:MAG: VOC family protein [Gammaproteobacteria bacterium]